MSKLLSRIVYALYCAYIMFQYHYENMHYENLPECHITGYNAHIDHFDFIPFYVF